MRRSQIMGAPGLDIARYGKAVRTREKSSDCGILSKVDLLESLIMIGIIMFCVVIVI
jgi:hypothetical protein